MSIIFGELMKYLHRNIDNFSCPICHQSEWCAVDENGHIQETKILDQSDLHDLVSPFEEFAIENGLEPEGTKLTSRPSPSFMNDVILIRCNHCGWIGTFDRKFLEMKIHAEQEMCHEKQSD